jgi:hypothetical protein
MTVRIPKLLHCSVSHTHVQRLQLATNALNNSFVNPFVRGHSADPCLIVRITYFVKVRTGLHWPAPESCCMEENVCACRESKAAVSTGSQCTDTDRRSWQHLLVQTVQREPTYTQGRSQGYSSGRGRRFFLCRAFPLRFCRRNGKMGPDESSAVGTSPVVSFRLSKLCTRSFVQLSASS